MSAKGRIIILLNPNDLEDAERQGAVGQMVSTLDRALQRAGHTVVCARTASRAIKDLRDEDADTVVFPTMLSAACKPEPHVLRQMIALRPNVLLLVTTSSPNLLGDEAMAILERHGKLLSKGNAMADVLAALGTPIW